MCGRFAGSRIGGFPPGAGTGLCPDCVGAGPGKGTGLDGGVGTTLSIVVSIRAPLGQGGCNQPQEKEDDQDEVAHFEPPLTHQRHLLAQSEVLDKKSATSGFKPS
jgi:hypothetical protein